MKLWWAPRGWNGWYHSWTERVQVPFFPCWSQSSLSAIPDKPYNLFLTMKIGSIIGLLFLIVLSKGQPFSYFVGNLQPTNSSPSIIIDNTNPPPYIAITYGQTIYVYDYLNRTLVSTLLYDSNISNYLSIFSSDFSLLVSYRYNDAISSH